MLIRYPKDLPSKLSMFSGCSFCMTLQHLLSLDSLLNITKVVSFRTMKLLVLFLVIADNSYTGVPDAESAFIVYTEMSRLEVSKGAVHTEFISNHGPRIHSHHSPTRSWMWRQESSDQIIFISSCELLFPWIWSNIYRWYLFNLIMWKAFWRNSTAGYFLLLCRYLRIHTVIVQMLVCYALWVCSTSMCFQISLLVLLY